MKKANIQGKWALVTGASRGIGRQISMGLADLGCNVVLHSRDSAGTRDLAEVVAGKGVQTMQVEAELADAGQVDSMLASLLAEGPPVDIVYNNAAIMTPYRSDWVDVPAADFRTSFEVNVTALIRICHAFIPGMVERKWGRIVNVTSGIADQPELIAYAVSKAAVDKFVHDTAGKLHGDGVLMNLLDPGWLRTDLGGPHAPGAVESVLPGALVPVLIDDGTFGQLFRAQDWAGKQI
ncbi:MAG: SDR family oxidoreductase [Armatimonadetes bacterium]|nr:SDR family oxidoreductase [Armatimonadota bacterium]